MFSQNKHTAAGVRLTPTQREHRRLNVAEAHLQGYSNRQIAELVSASKSTIDSDLRTMRKRWADRSLEDTGKSKARAIARLELLWRKACFAADWEQALKVLTKLISVEGVEGPIMISWRQQIAVMGLDAKSAGDIFDELVQQAAVKLGYDDAG